MRKIYRKLTAEQKSRGVIFSSTLSKYTQETDDDLIHEVLNTDQDRDVRIARLKGDSFFNNRLYNIIRRGQ